jgi:hypothetical protein
MGLVFDTDDAFLLSRAWSQGVLGTNPAALGNPLHKVSAWKDISIEDFISPDTLLVSNLKDSDNTLNQDGILSAEILCSFS